MATLNRRNVVIGPKRWEKLTKIANAEEKPKSLVIREALDLLFASKEKQREIAGYDPAKDVIG